MSSRLAPQHGEWIDRGRPVTFRFEGCDYSGFHGDVLASALWASGVRVMGRSFKYHRPRSVYTMAGYDANVIVETAAQTNLRGDQLRLSPGLDVRAVNTWGGLRGDRFRLMGRLSRFLPVGFYYKTFHRPRRLFPFFERQIRKAAGLGRLNFAARSPASPKDYDFCELLVIGAGPTGLAAALAAADAGVDVLIVDENERPGGSLNWQRQNDRSSAADLIAQANSHDRIRIRVRTMAGGWYADQWIALFDDRRLTKLRAHATIVAAGVIEQPAVFDNNDLPGVLLGSAAQRLIRQFAVKPFERVVVLTGNDDGYGVALDLAEAGSEVLAIVDLRPTPSDSQFARQAAAHNIPIHVNSAVVKALPSGDGALKGVVIRSCQGDAEGTGSKSIACDGLAVSVGWTPNSDIASQAGVRFAYSEVVQQLIPKSLPQGVFVAGRANGIYALEGRIADGRTAGLAAASHLGRQVEESPRPELVGPPPSHPYPIIEKTGAKNFVDFDEDIRLEDVVNACQEGFDSAELLKRYSTYGMGPSQGKLANSNAVRVLARVNGQSLERTGSTTARPFHHPVSIAHLAGRRFHPHRHTPMDAWHRQHGGQMIHVGAWFRPEYYSAQGLSRDDAILDEALAVRRGVGIIDISTLVKLHVAGPDATDFLERVYAVKFAKQRPGTLRYALACDEAGVLIEEGIVVRLTEDRFYITASTAGGDAFSREMQRWALVWQMNVLVANVTGHMGAINLAGPRAREVLQPLTDVSLAAGDFRQSEVRAAAVAGVPATILRAAFLGEVSFEIHLAALDALGVWSRLFEAGRSWGIRPFGTEAQRLLRLEKGHLIAGHDTDALTTPFEAGLGLMVKMDKPYFVGKRSLEMLQKRPQSRVLVGLGFSPSHAGPLPQECQLIIDGDKMVGRVTSIAPRSTLGRAVAMGFVRPDLARPGTKVKVQTSRNQFAEATVESLPFYDAENARQQ